MNPMKISHPIPNTILFTFDNRKDLTLSFARPQEYFESSNEELNGKSFSFYDIINHQMDADGNISYFSYWDGFNFSSETYYEWFHSIRDYSGLPQLTQHEYDLHLQLDIDGTRDKYYIIGCLEGDSDTIDHELSHAMFYLDDDYMIEMDKLTKLFYSYHTEYRSMVRELTALGYADHVLDDEIQAYMSTSKNKELRKDFGIDTKVLKPLIKEYRRTFKHFRKQHDA